MHEIRMSFRVYAQFVAADRAYARIGSEVPATGRMREEEEPMSIS